MFLSPSEQGFILKRKNLPPWEQILSFIEMGANSFLLEEANFKKELVPRKESQNLKMLSPCINWQKSTKRIN